MSRTVQTETLKASHLAKAYGGRPIVRDVSFEVQRGRVIGLLGPNGAARPPPFIWWSAWCVPTAAPSTWGIAN